MNQIESGVRYMARQTVETPLEEKIMARCGGLKAYGFINLLENRITRPGSCGYYMKFDESTYGFIARKVLENEKDEPYVRTIIRYALDIGYYDLQMFKKYHILTNRQIQENVFMVYNNSRKKFNVNLDYVLSSVIPIIKEYKKFEQFFEQNQSTLDKRNKTEQSNNINTFKHSKKDNDSIPTTPNSFLKLKLFKEAYPNKIIYNESIPDFIDMNLLLKKCKESEALNNFNNLGLDWLIKNYENVLKNVWRTVRNLNKPNNDSGRKYSEKDFNNLFDKVEDIKI